MTRKTKEPDKQKKTVTVADSEQKPFDPWTATPEDRIEVAISQSEIFIKNGTIAPNSGLAKLLVWMDLKEAECEYDKSEEIPSWYFLQLISRCFLAEISVPGWLSGEYTKRIGAIFSGKAKGWGDSCAFGEFPKWKQHLVNRNTIGSEIEAEIQKQANAGQKCPKDRTTLGAIAERLGFAVSDSEAEKAHQQWQRGSKNLVSIYKKLERFNK